MSYRGDKLKFDTHIGIDTQMQATTITNLASGKMQPKPGTV